MQIQELHNKKGIKLEGPLLITPNVFSDERGYFYESWNKDQFNKIVKSKIEFSQDNHSRSKKGVLRGLHYQVEPSPQGKLVRCTQGEIFDVIVDIREKSQTLGEWVAVELNDLNKKQLWVPEGFAHGFLTLSNFAEVQYKATNFWSRDSERSIIWNDKHIGIEWPLNKIDNIKPSLTIKDSNASSFMNAKETKQLLK